MAKRGFLIIAAVIFLVFIIPTVSSLSLAGAKLGTITYKPGVYFTNHYTIFGTDLPVIVMVDGGSVFPGIAVSDVVDNEFDLIVNFSAEETYIASGSYNFALTVVENSSPQDGISSQVAVSKNFEVVVYSYDKDIQASLSAPNINQGKNITFQLSVQSVGYPDLDEVYAKINLFNSTRGKRGSLETERKPLPGLGSLSFTPAYDTSRFSSGNYYAEAFVFYDGKYKTANTTFLIGIMDLILNNYTDELYPEFNEFEITVTNGWGNELRNVYAKLFLNDQEVVQTPSITLGPWEQGRLTAIANIELQPGTYPGILQLYFEDEMKEVPLTITVRPVFQSLPSSETEKELQIAKVSVFIPAVLSVIIILLVIGIYFLRRKKKEEW